MQRGNTMERGRPKTFKNSEDFLSSAIEYIRYCKDEERLPNVAGFCVYCMINRDTYYAQKEYFSDTFNLVEQLFEDEALNNKFTNDSLKIFYLKNKCGYRDRQEIDANVDTDVNINIEFEE